LFRRGGGVCRCKIFITCGKFGLALRLPELSFICAWRSSVAVPLSEFPPPAGGVKKLKYFPHGHVKKEYAVLPQRILEDPARFKKLVDQSIRFTSWFP